MIRILYIHNSADWYGASRSLLRLIRGLDRERFEPLVVLPEDGALRKAIVDEGVDVILDEHLSVITRDAYASEGLCSFLFRVPVSAWRLRRIIRDDRIDIVHTNVGTVVSGGLAARLAGVEHVWHIRDWYQEFRRLWWVYEPYIRWCSKRIIAVSQPVADQFRKKGKVVVINNGFDPEEFAVDRAKLRREFREEHGIGEDEFVVGCVGRIKKVRKGQEVVVKALGRLRRGGYWTRLLIVGAPSPGNEDHLEDLQETVRVEGMEEETIFLGELADVKPVYSAMDAFVLPSCQPEPFGGVVIEAMAMHLPVIATAIGGSLEQVEEGVTGFLVKPNDDLEIAGRVRELLNDREAAALLGDAGAERFERLFQFSGMLAKFEGIYDELTASREPSRTAKVEVEK